MAFEVLDVQSTPNPNAMKFVLNRPIAAQPVSFFDAESARSHSIGKQLFAITGVESVLLLNDFVTVNKTNAGRWADIKKKVEQVLSAAE